MPCGVAARSKMPARASAQPVAGAAVPGGGSSRERLHGARRGALRVATLLLLVLVWTPLTARGAQPADVLSPLETSRATGDLDKMIAKRRIRVLLVYSKTFYFIDRGRQRGTTYDFMRAFEDDLNRRLGSGHLRVSTCRSSGWGGTSCSRGSSKDAATSPPLT